MRWGGGTCCDVTCAQREMQLTVGLLRGVMKSASQRNGTLMGAGAGVLAPSTPWQHGFGSTCSTVRATREESVDWLSMLYALGGRK